MLPRETLHQQIHEQLLTVPTPTEDSAKEALNALNVLRQYDAISTKDDFGKRLRVLIALFDYIEQPTADAFRKQLAIMRAVKSKPS